jgi:hypothetical protein
MTNKTHGLAFRASNGAERVARCNQKRRMMGGHKMTLWLDKDSMDALCVLTKRYESLSRTKIIGHLIKLAAKAAS